MPASALQIAFFVFAVQFFAMLAARELLPAMGWPDTHFLLVGQSLSFATAAALLVGVTGLRRHCVTLLRVPSRAPAGEIAAAIATKAAVPFAVAGLAMLIATLPGAEAQGLALARQVDAEAAWRWFLSPAGLVSAVVLSWCVGPVIEEIVFRGLLQPALEARWGWARASLANGLLFATMHATHFTSAAVGSLVMACMWRRTRSLRDCIVVHAGYNMAISWPLLGQVLLAPGAQSPVEPASWLLHVAALALVTIALPAWVWLSANRLAAAH